MWRACKTCQRGKLGAGRQAGTCSGEVYRRGTRAKKAKAKKAKAKAKLCTPSLALITRKYVHPYIVAPPLVGTIDY